MEAVSIHALVQPRPALPTLVGGEEEVFNKPLYHGSNTVTWGQNSTPLRPSSLPPARLVWAKLMQRGERPYDLGDFEMILDLSESIMMLSRYERTFESPVSDPLESTLDQGEIYVDVGSNRGYHALEGASIVGDGGKVLAFEPNPENYRVLVDNARLNDFEHLDSWELAISDSNGQALFRVDKASGWGKLSENGRLEVKTRRLDDVLTEAGVNAGEVDLVKIDVEAAELAVLAGMPKILEESDAPVVVEVHDTLEELRALCERVDRELDHIASFHCVLR